MVLLISMYLYYSNPLGLDHRTRAYNTPQVCTQKYDCEVRYFRDNEMKSWHSKDRKGKEVVERYNKDKGTRHFSHKS